MVTPSARDTRKRLGGWYTPPELIDVVVDGVLDGFRHDGLRPVEILDPACGDGRFLTAVADQLERLGHRVALTGCDIDPSARDTIVDSRIRFVLDDALRRDWSNARFDVVIGNPPFLSQMASTTTRGGSSHHGGGPYADAATEFLALCTRLARPDGGRVGLVLPQSILGARDAGEVRRTVGQSADLTWSWWSARQQHFDAQVNVCAIGLQRPATRPAAASAWTDVVTRRLGIPDLDPSELETAGTLADRAELNANFRDEYYALVPAVADTANGPPLVTSGLIDPGRCLWGRRPVRFAKRMHQHPRVDLDALEGRFRAWAERKLAPKVLVANQTRLIEAVADPTGAWLPGVPVTTAMPADGVDVWEIAAVLTSPIASVAAWQRCAGTGLSTTSMRVGPASLGATAWPAGSLEEAVDHLRAGDVRGCATSVTDAYGVDGPSNESLVSWWTGQLPRRAVRG